MQYLVADTETTGAAEDDKVVEIGWIAIDENFNELYRIDSLIDPQRPIKASASGIHGLVDEDVWDAPTIEEFFSVPTNGCFGRHIEGPVTLIGHRIGFDRKFIEPFVAGELFELDTLRWVRYLYPDADDHKLSTMIYHCGLPRDSGTAHRVMADVLTALHLCRHVADKLGVTLPELAQRSRDPLPVAKMLFGKHKGEPVSQVPKSYLRWMKGNMDLDMDMTFTINQLLNPDKRTE